MNGWTESAINFFGRSARALFHPFFFELTNYIPSVMEKERKAHLAALSALTGTPHFSRLTVQIASSLGQRQARALSAGSWVAYAEEDLIATIVTDVVIFFTRMLGESSIQTDTDRIYPLNAIARKVGEVFRENMGYHLYRENPGLIPAPYPLNRLIASQLELYLACFSDANFLSFCNTKALEEEMAGSVVLDIAQLASGQVEKCFDGGQIIDAVVLWIEKEQLRSFFKEWLLKQAAHMEKEGTLQPLRAFLISWVKAIVLRSAESFPKTAFEDFCEGKITPEQFVDSFDVEVGVAEPAAGLLLPLLKSLLLQGLKKESLQDVFIWEKEDVSSLNEKEQRLSLLIAEKSFSTLKTSLDKWGGFLNFSEPACSSFLKAELFSDTRLSLVMKAKAERYIQTAFQKILVGAKKAIAKREAEDPHYLTLRLIEEVLIYLRYNLRALHRCNSGEIRKCNVLSVDLLHFMGVYEHNLPVPREWRSQVWVYLTEKAIPMQIKQVFDTYFSPGSMERTLYQILKLQEGDALPPPERAPEEFREQCILCVQEFFLSFNSSLLNLFPSTVIQKKFGGQVADVLYQNAKEWPMSRILNKGIDKVLEQLEHPSQTPHKEPDNEEIYDYIGHELEKQVVRAVASGVRKMKRKMKSPFDLMFHGIGRLLCDRATNYMDFFGYAVSNHLFVEEEPLLERVELMTESFLMVPGVARASNLDESDFEIL